MQSLENVKYPLENVKYPSGRICRISGIESNTICNSDRDELLENIENGIKDLAIKLLDMGYELVTSCEGHPEDECEFNYRSIGFCIEKTDIRILERKIQKLNRKFKLDIITRVTEIFDNIRENILCKHYDNPVKFDIIFGRYDKCERNYNTFLEHIDILK